MAEKPLVITQSGGDSLIQHSPIFSDDGKLVFFTCGSEVRVYSTGTGECVQRLVSHDDEVTGIAIHPVSKIQAITSSLDGTIKTWDYEDGILLKTCKIGHPLSGVYTCPDNKNSILLVTAESKGGGNLLKMPAEKIASGDITNDPELVLLAEGITSKLTGCAGFLSEGRYAVFCVGKKICVQDLSDKNNYVEHENRKEGKISCLACHPTDNCFATGHAGGVIKFWNNICPKKGKKPKPVVSQVQWHQSFVQDLTFTPGGASLLSIGDESVLVQWHYRQQGGKKNVFPRLNGQPRHIAVSPDATLYVTTLRDNAALVITNNFVIKHTIEGFTAAHNHMFRAKTIKMLEYDWKTRSCATLGKPGHLLFYKPHSDVQLYNLDITHKNYISGDCLSKREQTVITHVAFSQESKVGVAKDNPLNSTWMATVEEISDSPLVQDRKLKFWIFDETQQWWKLNTVINDPHKSNVTRIIFRPGSHIIPCLLTTGRDGMAKMWEIKESNEDSSHIFWTCFNVAEYRKLKACDGDFSQDGSLVAVAFGHAVCMTDPDNFNNMPLCASFAKDETVRRVLFGRHSCQHMLLIVLECSVQSFDLLTGGITWTVGLKTEHLIRDPLSGIMAVISRSRDLFIFKPSSALPEYTHKQISEKLISSAAFVPNVKDHNAWLDGKSQVSWMRFSRLFFVDDKMSVFTLCTDAEVERKRQTSTLGGSLVRNAENLKTPLASVLQRAPTEEDSIGDGKTIQELSYHAQLTALKKITDIPCHILPPATMLCKDFVMAFIPKKAKKQQDYWEGVGKNDQMDVDREDEVLPLGEGQKSSAVSELDERLSKVDLSSIENASYDDIFDGMWK